jgi:hypothetical protein
VGLFRHEQRSTGDDPCLRGFPAHLVDSAVSIVKKTSEPLQENIDTIQKENQYEFRAKHRNIVGQ